MASGPKSRLPGSISTGPFFFSETILTCLLLVLIIVYVCVWAIEKIVSIESNDKLQFVKGPVLPIRTAATDE
jgi:hypothetical protein